MAGTGVLLKASSRLWLPVAAGCQRGPLAGGVAGGTPQHGASPRAWASLCRVAGFQQQVCQENEVAVHGIFKTLALEVTEPHVHLAWVRKSQRSSQPKGKGPWTPHLTAGVLTL